MKVRSTLYLLAMANYCFSQWNYNPAINNAACVQSYNQINVKLISDLKDGAILVWEDYRNDSTLKVADIYAQRINAAGIVMWQINGVPICTDVAHQSSPNLVTDGEGGAIIVWGDERNTTRNLFAQRIDSSGNVKWATNGVGVTPKNSYQNKSNLESDGSNGVVVLWQDSAIGFPCDIYGQRLDPSGAQLWSGSGVLICNFFLSQINPRAKINAAGEIYVTWQDKRNGSNYDIFAQKLNLAGVPQWTLNGIYICNSAGTQKSPKIALVAGGGAIITWKDKRNGLDNDIYAQYVNSAGVTQWFGNGVPICQFAGYQSAVDITTQNISGAIITWKDGRNGSSNLDVYAQMINLSGVVKWTLNGIPVAYGAFNQKAPNISGDGVGGAIISFRDSTAGNWDVKSQRIDSSGSLLWSGGVNVGIAGGHQTNQSNINSGAGNSIYAFEDMRSGDRDIYAYKLDINGAPVGITQITGNKDALSVFPNPSNDKVTFRFENSNENRQLKIIDVNGNEIMSGEILHADKYQLTKKLEAGIYFYSIKSNSYLTNGKFIIVN